MLLSIDEAAARLGKSARQVRYLIQGGQLTARKVAGRWLIDSGDLPLSDGQREAVARKERQLRVAVEEGLGITPKDDRAARYSVRDLKAFQIALPLYREAERALGAQHAASVAIRRLLDQLSLGCHRFERQQKAEAYRQARDAASLAVCELVLLDRDDAAQLVVVLEQDLMAAIAGLLRRMDRGRDR